MGQDGVEQNEIASDSWTGQNGTRWDRIRQQDRTG